MVYCLTRPNITNEEVTAGISTRKTQNTNHDIVPEN